MTEQRNFSVQVPKGWHRVSARIRRGAPGEILVAPGSVTRGGWLQDVPSFASRKARGLVITPTVSTHREHGAWGITHRRSGLLVFLAGQPLAFETPEEAAAVAERIALLTDWTRPSSQMGDLRGNKALIGGLRDAIEAGLVCDPVSCLPHSDTPRKP